MLDNTYELLKRLNDGEPSSGCAEELSHLSKLLRWLKKQSKRKNPCPQQVKVSSTQGEFVVRPFDDATFFIRQLLLRIKPPLDSAAMQEYVIASTSFLLSNVVAECSKLGLIQNESTEIRQPIDAAIAVSDIALEGIDSRIATVAKQLSPSRRLDGVDPEAIRHALAHFIWALCDLFENRGQFIQAANLLDTRLKNSSHKIEQALFLLCLIDVCTTFNLRSRAELRSIIDEYEDALSPDELEMVRRDIANEPHLQEFPQILRFNLPSGELSLGSTAGKNIDTLISFSISRKCPQAVHNKLAKLGEGAVLFFSPIEAFWKDPLFKHLRPMRLNQISLFHCMGDMPMDGRSYTRLGLQLQGLHCPDVELEADGMQDRDFSEEEAISGRQHHPHKNLVIKTLRRHAGFLEETFQLKKHEITVDLFSNFCVEYFDRDARQRMFQCWHLLTNPTSVANAVSLFRERLNSANLGDAFVPIRDLLDSTTIESETNLKEFVLRCIDLCVKHPIELHKGYQYLWSREGSNLINPLREPLVQPYIFGQLRAVFDFMGIQISREVETANGEIDFLVSFTTTKNKLLRVCVELKHAHSSNLVDGLTKQLPEYMKGERCQHGIYFVLWYKGEAFEKPTNYPNIESMRRDLTESHRSKKISLMIVDCSKPTSPSKL